MAQEGQPHRVKRSRGSEHHCQRHSARLWPARARPERHLAPGSSAAHPEAPGLNWCGCAVWANQWHTEMPVGHRSLPHPAAAPLPGPGPGGTPPGHGCTPRVSRRSTPSRGSWAFLKHAAANVGLAGWSLGSGPVLASTHTTAHFTMALLLEPKALRGAWSARLRGEAGRTHIFAGRFYF